MGYSTQQIERFGRELPGILQRLRWLSVEFVHASQGLSSAAAREYLTQGVGRRVRVMARALENTFTSFPLRTTRPIGEDAVTDAQINLQAFLLNLYGSLDNCAWAFAYRHELFDLIKRRHDVGIFCPPTQVHFSPRLLTHVESMRPWFSAYVKDYRDALAHRIPLYIPPSELNPGDAERFNALEQEKIDALKTADFDRINEIGKEQLDMSRPCFMFLHSFSEGLAKKPPLLIHPQMLTDALTILEFSKIFLEEWGHCRQQTS